MLSLVDCYAWCHCLESFFLLDWFQKLVIKDTHWHKYLSRYSWFSFKQNRLSLQKSQTQVSGWSMKCIWRNNYDLWSRYDKIIKWLRLESFPTLPWSLGQWLQKIQMVSHTDVNLVFGIQNKMANIKWNLCIFCNHCPQEGSRKTLEA